MVKVCRQSASDLRVEHAKGMPPIQLTGGGFGDTDGGTITRLEAAIRLDAQADRWQAEIDTKVPNTHDRNKLIATTPPQAEGES
jgi:hypothetical protein